MEQKMIVKRETSAVTYLLVLFELGQARLQMMKIMRSRI
jgi:hypothetical protein